MRLDAPTIFLYKAGSNEIVQYNERSRTLDNLVVFIRDSEGLSIDLSKFSHSEEELREKAEDKMPDTVSEKEEAKAEL